MLSNAKHLLAGYTLSTVIAKVMPYTVIARRALPDVAIPSLYFVLSEESLSETSLGSLGSLSSLLFFLRR